MLLSSIILKIATAAVCWVLTQLRKILPIASLVLLLNIKHFINVDFYGILVLSKGNEDPVFLPVIQVL